MKYMGQDYYSVLGQMYIRLQSMSADFHSSTHGAHSVLWELCFEPAVSNGLRDSAAIFGNACFCETGCI